MLFSILSKGHLCGSGLLFNSKVTHEVLVKLQIQYIIFWELDYGKKIQL